MSGSGPCKHQFALTETRVAKKMSFTVTCRKCKLPLEQYDTDKHVHVYEQEKGKWICCAVIDGTTDKICGHIMIE